jgi:5-methylcytosine-specific restriction endonuclease McrBC regulatory subunit McrC
LDNSAISELFGGFRFKGFLLDMNKLFEQFVTQAFVTVARGSSVTVRPQQPDYLSGAGSLPVRIQPDITITAGGHVVGVVDAKYKRTVGTFENHDFYQMIAYGTALGSHSTYLFYPSTEWIDDRPLFVRNSAIITHILRTEIGSPDCVHLAEAVARSVLDDLGRTASVARP